MPKISFTIITKNSQKHIKDCILNIRDFADEIVIADDLSSDKTLEIAKKLGAKVYSEKSQGFGWQKNLAIDKSKNDWVFSIDSDERLDDTLKQELKNFDFKTYDGFNIKRKNHYGKKWVKASGFYPDWQLRLFKKSKMKFSNLPVHERVEPVGKIGKFSGHIIHYTYADDNEYITKVKKYSLLDAQVLFDKKRPWSISYQYGKPIKEFFYRYLKLKAYQDGWTGFKIAAISAYGRFLAAKQLKKLYENRH